MLIPDWQAVLRHAWSIRFMLLAAVLSGLEVAVAMLPPDTLPIEPGLAAALAGLVSAAALVARILAQSKLPDFLRDESGAVRKRTAAGLAGAASAVTLAVSFIMPWEGLRTESYLDIVGVATICYGETEGVRIGQRATPAECESRLGTRVGQFEAEIRPCLPASLPVETRAAFISAAYNIGSAGFCASSMSRRARAGDLAGACDALRLWNKAGGRVVRGLVNRREAERALCRQGLGL